MIEYFMTTKSFTIQLPENEILQPCHHGQSFCDTEQQFLHNVHSLVRLSHSYPLGIHKMMQLIGIALYQSLTPIASATRLHDLKRGSCPQKLLFTDKLERAYQLLSFLVFYLRFKGRKRQPAAKLTPWSTYFECTLEVGLPPEFYDFIGLLVNLYRLRLMGGRTPFLNKIISFQTFIVNKMMLFL